MCTSRAIGTLLWSSHATAALAGFAFVVSCVLGFCCGCVLVVVFVVTSLCHVSCVMCHVSCVMCLYLSARSLGVCWPSREVRELRRMANIHCWSLGSLGLTALVSGWIHA